MGTSVVPAAERRQRLPRECPHPERPHYALGRCKRCYEKYNRLQNRERQERIERRLRELEQLAG